MIMSQTKKPVPLLFGVQSRRQPCPVCGAISYSPAGIHPQCAMQQADAPRVEILRSARATFLANAKLP